MNEELERAFYKRLLRYKELYDDAVKGDKHSLYMLGAKILADLAALRPDEEEANQQQPINP